MPPYGRRASTTDQSICPRRLSACAAASSESIKEYTGLDGHHDAGFEHAREAQVRVTFGASSLAALKVAHDPADIVHLQSEQMTDTVGEEHTGDAELQRGLPAQFRQSDLLQLIAQDAVCGQ